MKIWGEIPLPQRKAAQMEAARHLGVFHDSQFSDQLKPSGLTFVHRVVDDVTKPMRMGHYDRGSAVAVADVDGGGLYDISFVYQAGGNELRKKPGRKNLRTSLASRVSKVQRYVCSNP
jgi:hypothetical protein